MYNIKIVCVTSVQHCSKSKAKTKVSSNSIFNRASSILALFHISILSYFSETFICQFGGQVRSGTWSVGNARKCQ